MSLREGLSVYYRNFGLRGVLAISGFRLFKYPREIEARPPGLRHPVYLRLRTTDVATFEEIMLWGEYDWDLPFSPKTIVDAGANIGMASIYFAHRYPHARVIAIEPEIANFRTLARNVRFYPSIVPIHAALWDRDGQISVEHPDATAGVRGEWGFVTREGPGASVRAITMRTLMQELSIATIDLAKIDIEGAEVEVFRDTGWLAGLQCLMIESHDRLRHGCSEGIDAAMQGFARSQKGETTTYLREGQPERKKDVVGAIAGA